MRHPYPAKEGAEGRLPGKEMVGEGKDRPPGGQEMDRTTLIMTPGKRGESVHNIGSTNMRDLEVGNVLVWFTGGQCLISLLARKT